MKVELDLSNYATKVDLKNATVVDTSKFAKKFDLANLKSNVDKLDIDELENVPTNSRNLKSKVDKLDADKLVPVPVNLSKLSDVVKMISLKKMYIMLKSKLLITNLATSTTLYAKIIEVKKEITTIIHKIFESNSSFHMK